ncbi:MAG: glutamine--fructose-6-phosphate transaminase (isomerizing) [Nitrospirae bacterium]|nr:glutamine--fructose-6-phosphate transaminase (isomerizing) [Nitrospirota bacterium]MCL5285511.1 glutamine--fructose-6-phosphate transaminase (isomerizing) [Nitrospirota bacterium]
MCGIIGYAGSREPVGIVLEALSRLEYRGYDSSGVAYFGSDGKVSVARASGKLSRLSEALQGTTGIPDVAIGHIRWATHGAPTEENAHPHRSGPIVLVHNGIIENERALRRELVGQGYVFSSETDTEVLAHLILRAYREEGDLSQAVRKGLASVEGSYALAVLCEEAPGQLVAVRKGAPLILGEASGEYFVASDVPAFLKWTRRVMPLPPEVVATLSPEGLSLCRLSDGQPVPAVFEEVPWDPVQAEKGHYRHFMEKEIFEGPRAIMDTLEGRLGEENSRVFLPELVRLGPNPTEIVFVACGTSYHAALLGRLMIEALSPVPVRVEIASEFRYRPLRFRKGAWVVGISQSGETADTLGALEVARREGYLTVGVTNVGGSSITRETEAVLLTRAGPEIGVASTKAFIAQVTLVWLLALYLGRRESSEVRDSLGLLVRSPARLEGFLGAIVPAEIDRMSRQILEARFVIFIGRGVDYPLAIEGALKMKEITYRPADGYPGGELKHGPIALVEPGVLVVAPLVDSRLRPKETSNIREIEARGGTVLTIGPAGSGPEDLVPSFLLPETSGWDGVFFASAVLQLLAYRAAFLAGNDVDQPRNLAKSVTVE